MESSTAAAERERESRGNLAGGARERSSRDPRHQDGQRGAPRHFQSPAIPACHRPFSCQSHPCPTSPTPGHPKGLSCCPPRHGALGSYISLAPRNQNFHQGGTLPVPGSPASLPPSRRPPLSHLCTWLPLSSSLLGEPALTTPTPCCQRLCICRRLKPEGRTLRDRPGEVPAQSRYSDKCQPWAAQTRGPANSSNLQVQGR